MLKELLNCREVTSGSPEIFLELVFEFSLKTSAGKAEAFKKLLVDSRLEASSVETRIWDIRQNLGDFETGNRNNCIGTMHSMVREGLELWNHGVMKVGEDI